MSLKRYIYAWLDHNLNWRSKVKYSAEEPDWWQYDGSSTGQAPEEGATEVYLKPVQSYSLKTFLNTEAPQILVICETYLSDKTTPHPDNKRHGCVETMSNLDVKSADPWYGFELEFFIMDAKTDLPLGFKKDTPPAQGQFYCSVGGNNCFGRQIMDEFEAQCLLSGISIVGSNAEVACGQWEYQIFGKGLAAADDAWASRFILDTVAERHGAYISWHPKPYMDCNGSGMHVNFSTADMRDPVKGRGAIKDCLRQLSLRHQEHLDVYGDHNELRLTGKHETSSMEYFTHGIGTRNTSVRINHDTAKNWCGYIEDRRPASSCDMYSVVKVMADTVIIQTRMNTT